MGLDKSIFSCGVFFDIASMSWHYLRCAGIIPNLLLKTFILSISDAYSYTLNYIGINPSLFTAPVKVCSKNGVF